MAQLFSLGMLKDNTKILHGFDQSKIDIIQDLYNDYKHGLLEDEVKYKEKFNQVFFGELLGYENRIHRIPEGHIKGVGNADIILGNFLDGKEDAELIQIACELKGAKSNLVKKQYGHGGLSPVGQGFSYKTGLKNCKWLIVSNFFETRLYRDNQTDFEIWNLETLLDSKDDYFNLKSLYLLLHKDNLLANTGTSKTEDLLSHFRDEQLEITKKFYKEYKQLRLELLEDVKKRNPLLSVNTLVEKGQKIIDRLIFIFFCEDRGLLPDKKLKEGIERAGEFGFSPREMTKRFFEGVDKGNEKLGIPDGYNGGLFKDDATLNSLNIGDDICRKFVELTNYDFHDDLSVNVLGHIFEQSISDLEEIKEDLIGKESKVLQESKGRRKKDGIFYTPEYIVDYIVQNSVMKYLNEKEDECLKKHNNKKNGEVLAYQEYQHILQNIKVLDPACGSGAFLVRVFDVLFEENKRVGSILNSLFDDTQAYKNILTNNIYGVDLNDESVEISKLSLRLKSAQKGKKLNNLDTNIKCGNSLIDDPEIAGNKAFDWNIEFKEIMDEGGFDVIVGNPPYVVNKKDSILSKTYDRDTDLYLMFFEKSLKCLMKDQFYFGFITPRFFLVNKNTSGFRKYLLHDINLIELVETSPFEDAETECVISIISSSKQKNKYIEIYEDIGENLEALIKKTKGRMLIATFASNVGRIIQIVNSAIKANKVVFLSGRSMVNNVEICQQLGYIKVPDGYIRKLSSEVDTFDDDRVLILSTGAQGEEFAALTRMARNEHNFIHLKKGDTILMSATPIPGNEGSVNGMINNLVFKDINLITNDDIDVHASGHGGAEDHKLMLSLLKPQFFLPFFMPAKERYAHKHLAMDMGMPESNILMPMKNGEIIEMYDNTVLIGKERLKLDTILVDGKGKGHLSGEYVIKARSIMAEDGVLALIFKVDAKTKELVGNIQIESRGFVYSSEVKDIHTKVVDFARAKYQANAKRKMQVRDNLKILKEDLGEFITQIIGRVPMIMPMFVYINKDSKDDVTKDEAIIGMTIDEQGGEVKKI